ncbi:MAG: cytochrome-c oxidase, cbb3-type subunit III [Alphaproteobacteria bacterium]|uniref:Cbb3-type cytochrome c oxidase subunit n=1 Tax=Celeribacter baekdonensis TaxID=875171 RepID=A0A1G7M1E1_9RHOB|nr:cytochrome-c oxidase, cbb3-type subunit III [Celeribacter baekdonensis]MBU0645837.1 cytochrome-c oxidase, cbb3-type subunit III [Alphaproteobacteria bacterium]MBU1280028.1 cytochrome-c oxidase, cbb3-type subunit III [Alphaproteobacteria bacterium]MBU1572585.1 cytochrome-c oxidase, cbb3-type subunit III [Alphaproteobacteria bacterium]MBU1828339.1 cytochrome-c oxidase, cbb3-type subunit III [Alphaproteobacteria bacterium]MBU2078695.1 cytochrome-c oxidase, cbb3-type subunit III [Alphaproteobac
MSKKDVETTGHSWDGIEELNNPLPRWWLMVFYACIIWAIAYSIAMPAWPGIKTATAGMLGWSTRAEVAKDIASFEEMNAGVNAELASADVTTIDVNSDLHNYGVNMGAAVFRANCSQCHGSGAAGNVGYPNLLDNDWLWGGTIDEVAYTIQHGVRNETDEARYSEMPKFGADELLEPAQIDQVVEYVLSMSGQDHDAAMATEGAVVFADNCAACHLEDGTGDLFQGAPNLTDAIWLYGGDRATIKETVTNARFGVMPAWGQRLSQAEVNAAALYVHQLGGGQ